MSTGSQSTSPPTKAAGQSPSLKTTFAGTPPPIQKKPKETEPTSTGAPVWKGGICFPEEKVKVPAFNLVKGTAPGEGEIPSDIAVEGWIAPDTFWDYFKKIVNAEDRTISVFKFLPASDVEKQLYETFFHQIHKKIRYSVMKMTRNKTIKDFCVLSLHKDSPFPLALSNLLSDIKSNLLPIILVQLYGSG